MRLGDLDLTRRDPDALTRSTLLRAWRASGEPARTLVQLAALGLHVAGPADLPRMRPGLDYADYGATMRDWLGGHGCDLTHAAALGMMAVEAEAQRQVREPPISEAQAKEYADFFGVTPPGSPASASPTATSETPSAG